jgi:hypothetical protein
MASIKVDLLTKEELLYELKLRNIVCDGSLTVDTLRKMLRKCIKENIPALAENLVGKISVNSELEILELKIGQCHESVAELTETSRPIDVCRNENKIEHCRNRLNIVLKFQIDEAQRNKCKELMEKIRDITESLNKLNMDVSVKENAVRRISESNIEEEELLDDVFAKDESNLVASVSKNLQAVDVSGSNVYTKNVDTKVFRKLPNPLESYFKDFKATDGLNCNDFIEFLKLMYKIKEETEMSDRAIIEMFVYRTSGALHNKLIENRNKSITDLHSELMRCFMPLSLRDSLIRKFVNRPQSDDEALPNYVNSVKVYAKIFQCSYSEREIVEFIKMGINMRDRANLVFTSNPRTFKDLDELCIMCQNVNYHNFVRDDKKKYINRKDFHVNNVGKVLTCYNCNRPGHIAKHCFRKTKNM